MKQKLYKDNHTCPNKEIDEKIERYLSEVINNKGKDYDLAELECHVMKLVMDSFLKERINRRRFMNAKENSTNM